MPRVIAKTVKERWEEFARGNLPPEMDAANYAEAKRLYYAGYLEALGAVQELREGGIDQADALRVLDGHAEECAVLLCHLTEDKSCT